MFLQPRGGSIDAVDVRGGLNMLRAQKAVGRFISGVGVLLVILGIALAAISGSYLPLVVPCVGGLVLIVLGRKLSKWFRPERLADQRRRLEKDR